MYGYAYHILGVSPETSRGDLIQRRRDLLSKLNKRLLPDEAMRLRIEIAFAELVNPFQRRKLHNRITQQAAHRQKAAMQIPDDLPEFWQILHGIDALNDLTPDNAYLREMWCDVAHDALDKHPTFIRHPPIRRDVARIILLSFERNATGIMRLAERMSFNTDGLQRLLHGSGNQQSLQSVLLAAPDELEKPETVDTLIAWSEAKDFYASPFAFYSRHVAPYIHDVKTRHGLHL